MQRYARINPNERISQPMFMGFVRDVENFGISQGERTEPFAELKRLLEQVIQDTIVIHTRTERSSKLSKSMGLSSDSATL
uniref:Uncharacterized protein n=1 Tax=Talaromyces marneffei PM1 TaxID=1077442 RepID=A0A093UME8_TALMA